MTSRLHIRDGKYCIIINYKDDAGKYRQKWIHTGLSEKNNKRRAEQLLQEALRDFEQEREQRETALETISMKALIEEWLAVKKTVVRPNSHESYREAADRQVTPYFEALGVLVEQLQPVHVQRYYTEKSGEGLSAATLEKHRTIIRGALEYARNTLQLIEHNPADRVTLPRKEKRVPKFYTKTQLKKLFIAVEGESIEAPVRLSATYGLRRSEALGLQWSAIDWQRKTVAIQHTVVRVGAETICDDLVKSGSSFRTMPLTADMEAFLRGLQAHQKQMKKLCGKSYLGSDYICVWDDGRPLDPDYVTSRFNRFLKDKKLLHIRYHDLRHSSASLLINMGFTLKEVQEWLGQASSKSTEIYAHLLYKSKENMAEKIGKALSMRGKGKESTAASERA